MFNIVLLCIFTLKLQTSYAQYPNHMDLQKVGEAIFNNEKFNILKPTTHIISDYFKEFMLRQNTDFPTKRIFIDRNGLRHFWTGFGTSSKSLRKTDDINANLITNTADNTKTINIETNFGIENIKILNTETFIIPSKGRRNVKSQIKKQALRGGGSEDNEKADENTTKANDATTTVKADEVITEKAEVDTTIHTEKPVDEGTDKPVDEVTEKPVDEVTEKPVDGDIEKPVDEVTENAADETTTDKATTTAKSKAATKAAERVVAKTTFFCPFFGVITMAAFID